ncbi:hypothetical protein [Desulfitobacterium metallireducens]|uniref:Uncharacterized protein n=1 Tax=Desulfitobacterium metallireducens DSM 15288 TaxID=871968 RepID=W0EGB3_9FIRM|nr:hypothetical protein [Desulfitobacterium metallireducens]AHF08106.1 hypothetical protein DESME_14540 [Desulfitobacterium metallireducens DSM 15288]
MEFDKRKVLTLAGTLVLAGAVVVGGIYGPSAWKVFMDRSISGDQNPVVMQTPPVDDASATSIGAGGNTSGQPKATGASPASTVTNPPGINVTPQGDVSGSKKYKEPDTKDLALAPSVQDYFGDGALSQDALNLAFSASWNVHQYVDGYLYGPNAGPQMNEQDIKKYIVFHKSVWDNQMKKEAEANKASSLSNYLDVMFNRGIDAFNAKDKVRIEQFHQEIHDLDAHILRNDTSAKIYGATPFATKR